MRLLLTGGFGNIGSHVLAELQRRGHQVRCLSLGTPEDRRRARGVDGVDVVWGDIRDPATVTSAVAGVEAVLHLAAVIPPASEDDPEYARQVNVDGTRAVVRACTAQARPPKLVFASTFDVHGHTLHRDPPRRVDDPTVPTDAYTAHKIAGEEMVRASGLDWFIPRLADVPIIGIRPAEPIMFEIGLDNRIEVLHPADAAVAVANALDTPQVWGRVLFLGGGPACQLTYREYLTRMLGAMSLDMLPDNAFSGKPYATDWLDTAESQRLLAYQSRGVDDIVADIAATLGWRRYLTPLARPLARRAMLRLSPYAGATGVAGGTAARQRQT
ncbi:NAD-dependent epimerase/dehydratase family protein [Rhodococcus sp. NPDC127528]|uniref:NAD-dependent epimerase/dehydratase family protein n=1 Tax=unclassified Rhodococcus (in: high G+C Gram-positive bacteria) TaxID=192944 RepID=UPI0036330B8B